MAIPEEVDSSPSTLRYFEPENISTPGDYKAPAIPTPLNPEYRPDDKDEAKQNISIVTSRFDDYKKSQLQSGTAIKITSGRVEKWVEEGSKPKPEGWTDEEWEAYSGSSGGSGKWVPDIDGQLLLDEIDYAERLSKELSGSSGAAGAATKVRSPLDIEGDKADEIARQFKDFANRASLYYDLQQEEQEYGMRADDQNIQNWDAQKKLGLAGNPGGFYATPYQNQSLSSILGPSLPDYVRPDYRLNEVVGLPGPQGFDDPDYNEYGLPMFAQGTDIPWPWPPRGK